ncbi:prolyl oligopeptidase family serine peptidase [Nocardioides sp. TF02-7]|uniref:prolyl oligopeptidase family serine peptidase n=1 Tax=Nocardioides sp. TF02-7 TaxID=2917724 RepID=UPI001F0692C4|nr:prolyl oligopeptidase family serine peptidase [Nocardioides sp. TF02-7]UMG95001.1 prolyl oligopeptidase family serine peptidase [Nocardioides sp. TF02-7]
MPLAGDQDWTTWTEVRAGRPDERVERVDAFAGHVVLSVRSGWEHRLRLLPHDDLGGDGVLVSSRFPCGAVHLARSTDYAATAVVVVDRAHVQPEVWRRVDLATGRESDVGGQVAPGHDPGRYVTERLAFPLRRRHGGAGDGGPPPRRAPRRDGTRPALRLRRLRVHVRARLRPRAAQPARPRRGLRARPRARRRRGRAPVVAGGPARAQAEHLHRPLRRRRRPRRRPRRRARIATRGLSAGGLLQGAVLSQRPDRWRAVVAEVPFVDVVTTMLDDTVPLTVNEWEEWGDPHRPEDHAWMLAYSPYDNLPPVGVRPDLLVTGALHDPRVGVHEPAKWVAALRASDTAWAPRCLFRCEVGAGAHDGPSGRYGHLAYEAEVYAWVLDRLGVVAP